MPPDITVLQAPNCVMGQFFFFNKICMTSKEISDLEGEHRSIRDLSTSATLSHNLAEEIFRSNTVTDCSSITGLSNDKVREPSDMEKWSTKFPDFFDVLLAKEELTKLWPALPALMKENASC